VRFILSVPFIAFGVFELFGDFLGCLGFVGLDGRSAAGVDLSQLGCARVGLRSEWVRE
jgi:hypothetical protein